MCYRPLRKYIAPEVESMIGYEECLGGIWGRLKKSGLFWMHNRMLQIESRLYTVGVGYGYYWCAVL